MMKTSIVALVGIAALVALGRTSAQAPFATDVVGQFDAPWAMEFLPDGRLLVSEKSGTLKLRATDGRVGEVSGVPDVVDAGQASFGDVVLHPAYDENHLVYISYAEAGDGGSGAAVARARLVLDETGGGNLADLQVIWRQDKTDSTSHYSQRIAFGHGYLWISSGERARGEPAQNMSLNQGKILRLNDDGTVPADNPFADHGGVTAQIWTLGHRNPLGLAFDADGQLWNVEMGPQGGDELNRVERGQNYGWPIVSNGVNYGGGPIPDHPTRPEFKAPAEYWVPSISPSSLMFYSGDEFPAWQGDAFIGGLSSEAIIRIEFDGEAAREADRFDMGARIRAVEQGPDGAIYALEDPPRRGRGGVGADAGGGGRLLRLTAN